VSIGQPIAKHGVFVLDANRNPVPAGHTGGAW
jgi:hypothetical protein